MVDVRLAVESDADAVLALWLDADAEPTVTDDQDAIRALLRRDADALLLGVDVERIVGTLIVGWDGWRGSFYRLVVAKDRRRQGIARMLVAEGERRLVDLGARRLALFAVTGDPGAVEFWQAVGYEPQLDRRRLFKNVEVKNVEVKEVEVKNAEG